MENEFNELEMEVLSFISNQYPESVLSKQIGTAKFIKREWTEVGFFVHFAVDQNEGKLDIEKYGGGIPIEGPGLESNDIEHGGGSLLWAENGYLNCLELFAYGAYFKEEIQDYNILSINHS